MNHPLSRSRRSASAYTVALVGSACSAITLVAALQGAASAHPEAFVQAARDEGLVVVPHPTCPSSLPFPQVPQAKREYRTSPPGSFPVYAPGHNGRSGMRNFARSRGLSSAAKRRQARARQPKKRK